MFPIKNHLSNCDYSASREATLGDTTSDDSFGPMHETAEISKRNSNRVIKQPMELHGTSSDFYQRTMIIRENRKRGKPYTSRSANMQSYDYIFLLLFALLIVFFLRALLRKLYLIL